MATLNRGPFEEALAVGQSGNISRAVELLRQAVRETPDHVDAWGNLGYLLQLSGKSQEAIPCLHKVLEFHPEDPGAHKLLGDCFLSLGRKSEAREAYRRLEGTTHYNDPDVQLRLATLEPVGSRILRRSPHLAKRFLGRVGDPKFLPRLGAEVLRLSSSLPGIRASGWGAYLTYLERHYLIDAHYRFDRPACDFCGGHRFEATFFLAGQKNVRCRDCGLQFVERKPEESLDVFADWYNQDSSIEYMEQFWENENYFRHRIGLLEETFAQAGQKGPSAGERAFEVGCAEGHLLQYLAGKGLEVEGIETGGKLADYCRKVLSLSVSRATIRETPAPKEPFDYFFAYHVLEHLEKPSELFLKAREFLREGGTLFIEVPIPDLTGMTLNQQLDTLHGFGNLGHLHYFTGESLSKYFPKFGFELIGTYRYNEETLPSGGFLGKRV